MKKYERYCGILEWYIKSALRKENLEGIEADYPKKEDEFETISTRIDSSYTLGLSDEPKGEIEWLIEQDYYVLILQALGSTFSYKIGLLKECIPGLKKVFYSYGISYTRTGSSIDIVKAKISFKAEECTTSKP